MLHAVFVKICQVGAPNSLRHCRQAVSTGARTAQTALFQSPAPPRWPHRHVRPVLLCARACCSSCCGCPQAARKHGWTDGSCAVCALVVGDRVFIANVGDSKVRGASQHGGKQTRGPRSACVMGCTLQAVLCLRKPVDAAAEQPATAAQSPSSSPCPHKFHKFKCLCTARPPASAKAMTQVRSVQVDLLRLCTKGGRFCFVLFCVCFAATHALTLHVRVPARSGPQDHAPILASERRRIESCGGRVDDGRVNGMLGVARTFGDISLKRCVWCGLCAGAGAGAGAGVGGCFAVCVLVLSFQDVTTF